jgi:hypothetical protein
LDIIIKMLSIYSDIKIKLIEILYAIMDISGLAGFELANIILFFIFQPLFSILFFILWRIEKKNPKLKIFNII